MIITIFRTRLRPEQVDAYSIWAKRMHDLAVQMPGFISIKTFSADDGERVSIVEFESEETMRAWREHPEHRQAQELGKKQFYSDYRVQVCQPIRDYHHPKSAGPAA